MNTSPACEHCAHLQGTSQCGRPVPSYWNAATNQRRSRLCVPITAERSDRKVLAAGGCAADRKRHSSRRVTGLMRRCRRGRMTPLIPPSVTATGTTANETHPLLDRAPPLSSHRRAVGKLPVEQADLHPLRQTEVVAHMIGAIAAFASRNATPLRARASSLIMWALQYGSRTPSTTIA